MVEEYVLQVPWDITSRETDFYIVTVCNEVAKVMFSQACVCPHGGLVLGESGPGGCLVPGGLGPGGIPACTEADPPGETATAADGMHPTGMHSCCADMSLYPQSCNSRLFPFLFIDCAVRMSRGCVEISTAVLFVAAPVAVLARPTAGRPLRYTDWMKPINYRSFTQTHRPAYLICHSGRCTNLLSYLSFW